MTAASARRRGARSVDGSVPPTQPVFVISVAAELAGMHPQTLRQYDRLGLVTPARTKGRGRRYSSHDVQRLRDIQRMSQDQGINLAGIERILELQRRVERLESEREALRARLEEFEMRRDRVFAATSSGEVSPLRRGQRPWTSGVDEGGALIPWDPWQAFDLQAVAASSRLMRERAGRRLLGRGPSSRGASGSVPGLGVVIEGVVH